MLFYNLIFSYFFLIYRNNHKYIKIFLLGLVIIFPLFTPYDNGDVRELLRYYDKDLFLLTSTYFSFIGWNDLFLSPYINLFSPSQKFEIFSRNLFFYFKFLNLPFVFTHILLNLFFFFSLKYFLDSIKINKKIYIYIFIFIIFSKLNLYYSLNIFRFYLAAIFFYLTFAFLLKKKHIFLVLLFSTLSIISHFSVTPLLIILLICNYLKKYNFEKIYTYKYSIIFFCIFYSYFLIYNPLTEIFFERIFFDKFIISKISNYLIDSTGSQSHQNYGLLRILLISFLIFLINYLNNTNNIKVPLILKKFIFFSFIFLILFSFNTFIWKKYFLLIMPIILYLFFFEFYEIYKRLSSKFLRYSDLILIITSTLIIFLLFLLLMNYFYFLAYCFLILTFIYNFKISNTKNNAILFKRVFNDLLFLFFIFYSTYNLTSLIKNAYLL